MGLFYEIRRRSRAAAVPVLCASAIAYFGYHLAEGERGLRAYGRLVVEIEEARADLTAVSQERRRLEHRVSLLKPDALDLDMLEEQAQRQLGLAHRDDVVVFPKR